MQAILPIADGGYGDYRQRRMLVTGGAGFIGRHLVAELARGGARMRILARPGREIPLPWSNVEVVRGVLEDIASLERACEGVDTVFHAAGLAHAWADRSPAAAALHWQVNAVGTRDLLNAAVGAGVACFVFFSSVKAMGEGGERCIDENWPLPPETPYGKAKRAAEAWVLDAGKRSGMRAVNLRPALVYGPGGRGNLERMIAAVRKGIFPPLPEVGNQRSMVHVMDLVRAALCAADHPGADRKTYIVTDGRDYSGRELYELIRRGLGKPVARWAVPAGVLRSLAKTGDMAGWICGRRVGFDSEALDKLLGWAWYSSDRIRRELDWRPALTLADALPEILQEALIAGKVAR